MNKPMLFATLLLLACEPEATVQTTPDAATRVLMAPSIGPSIRVPPADIPDAVTVGSPDADSAPATSDLAPAQPDAGPDVLASGADTSPVPPDGDFLSGVDTNHMPAACAVARTCCDLYALQMGVKPEILNCGAMLLKSLDKLTCCEVLDQYGPLGRLDVPTCNPGLYRAAGCS